MDKQGHNGIGAGFPCDECGDDTVYVDYATDGAGVIAALLLTCRSCGNVWTESVRRPA